MSLSRGLRRQTIRARPTQGGKRRVTPSGSSTSTRGRKRYIYVYICIYIYVCIYTYSFIYSKSQTYAGWKTSRHAQWFQHFDTGPQEVYICMYYIYICMYIHIFIYLFNKPDLTQDGKRRATPSGSSTSTRGRKRYMYIDR